MTTEILRSKPVPPKLIYRDDIINNEMPESYEWFWQQSHLFSRLVDYFTDDLEELKILEQVDASWKQQLEKPDNHLIKVLMQLDESETLELLSRTFIEIHRSKFKTSALLRRLNFGQEQLTKQGVRRRRIIIQEVPSCMLLFKTPKISGTFIQLPYHPRGYLNFWAQLSPDNNQVKKWTEFCQDLEKKLTESKDFWDNGKYRDYEVVSIVKLPKDREGNLNNYPPSWTLKFDKFTEFYDHQTNRIQSTDSLLNVKGQLKALISLKSVWILEATRKIGFTIKVLQVRFWQEQQALPVNGLILSDS